MKRSIYERKKQIQKFKSQSKKRNLIWFYKLKPLDIYTYIDLDIVFNFSVETMIKLINFFKKNKLELTQEFYDKFKGINNKLFKDYFFINKYGWFPDKEIYLYYYFFILILKDDEKESKVNEILSKHTKKNIKKIKFRLLKKYPKLTQNINEAFEAHKNSKYTLSIPAFLIMVDHICYTSFNESFYSKGKIKRLVKNNLKPNPKYRNFYKAFFKPFIENLPIMYNSTERNENDSKLIEDFGYNRHEIMHGLNINYYNEVNSLKIISLLNYISQCDDILNKKRGETC